MDKYKVGIRVLQGSAVTRPS